MCVVLCTPVSADTSTEIDITVEIESVGSLTVEFAEFSGGYEFRNSAGVSIFRVSAVTGDTATTSIRVAWSDDRTDESRSAFQIGLHAADLTSTVQRPDGAGVYAIPAQNLSIISINGIAITTPNSLEQSWPIFSSGAAPNPGEGVIDIVLHLTIPPSIYPTTYSTQLILDMDPTEGGI